MDGETGMETAKSPWVDILTTGELDARYALTASLDPRFAASQRRWYEARTAAELVAVAA